MTNLISDISSNNGAFAHLIDGCLATSTTMFDVINPSSETVLAKCPDASKEQLDRAVSAARRAFPQWKAKSYEERRNKVLRFCDGIQDRIDSLARLLTEEQGKPLVAAKAEVERALFIARHLVGIEIEPEVLRCEASGKAELHYKPLGVVGGITPWNVPIIMAVPKIAAALYTGNTMILKPSPYTPLTTLRLGEIALSIFPDGVMNILAGGNDLGQWMVEHPGIDKINFTGSVATGKKIMASASGNMKRLTLELGGNDAAIVLSDVDPQAVAGRLFQAAFANSGQVCQAIKRLYVHQDIYEAVIEELVRIARSVKVGDGLMSDVVLGPIQNKAQYQRVLDILEDTARQPGVRIYAGSQAPDTVGYFIAPIIVANIREGTRLVDEEPFGPILPVMSFTDIEDVIARANNTRFGLGASVWTTDIRKGAEIAGQLESGVAWVNHHVGTSPDLPFGGIKESGMGRANGAMGLKRHMEPQLLVLPSMTDSTI
ncbi:aldehyde dehydrogenase family protein [Noviherbaspirillum pedocola]|uniref:Aldehyde dehydrogenase family protein n=1 Tax=Noviherbaspirillum pedocola TaxID=2801341 RepID=A0A934W4H6_9BURK|nr:aldehyde dehydrogenase family protein [Noviherbaspirillum pedocola]MBK4738536.1 aldehyde dehydrogenase family protein [Noviherbaspirillum pedocola]